VPHLELVGEVDLSTAGPLKLRLELIEREEPETIVVDLRRVTFMDSIGLGILLAHHLRGRKLGRQLQLVQGPRQIQDLFTLTGTQDKFEWVPAPS
jgi:anti-anti-sigma factor